MPYAPGTRLGPYEILELAGAGGMGEVYRAHDTRLRRTVAIKVASAEVNADPQLRARFQREARAIAALNHPHICAIHDVVSLVDSELIVMEFLEGETLEERLRKGPIPTAELLPMAMAIVDALSEAHRQGIVHRDLKPSNVMLTRSGLKLLDFGIAKQTRELDSASSMRATETSFDTIDGTLVGTVPYMAPEQLELKTVDARTDIFAFGCVLFEMATGRPAFAGESTAALVAAILADSRPVASQADARLPRSLDRIISTCLARNPDDRCQHARDLLRELRWVNEDLGDPASLSRAARVTASSRWRVHVAWASALIAVAFLAVWFSPRASPEHLPAPNAVPVIVLMDSPLPGRVYDPRTLAEGGTNADDVTDALRDLGAAIRKENTSAAWHREEQVVGENPDLIVAHLSCLLDARVGEGQAEAVADHLFDLAENRFIVFLAYVAARNPRTRFIVYSRTVFQTHGGEEQWVAAQVARLPVLKGRLNGFIVPGREKASFRDQETARLLRTRVGEVLGQARR